jgi:uncharacterized C2H2 Zn-finger protein
MSDIESENIADVEGSLEAEDDEEDVDDRFNLFFSITVAETDTTEIDNEFNEAVSEIEGKKSFECDKCDKVCKSKGGLTRHTNSKHGEPKKRATTNLGNLDKETVDGFVEAIKARIIKEDIYNSETDTALAAVKPTKALFEALLPLYETFCRKKNQDILLESFYGLIPRSYEFLKGDDYKIANLIMIQLPDFLVGFFNTSNIGQTQVKEDTPHALDQAETGPLSYIAGYIISKLYRTNTTKKGRTNEEIQTLLEVMKSTDETSNHFIAARSRGGLISPCDDLINILKVTEVSFRCEVSKSKEILRNIPTEVICNSVLESPAVKSLWENIVLSSGVETSSPTQKLCLENVIKLYLKVRSFSCAKDYIAKYKIKEKQTKTKALRKDLKMSSQVEK